MKWIITVAGVLVCSVAFMYYLFSNQYFLPFDEIGQYDWLNISVVVLLGTVIFTCLIFLVAVGLISLLKKGISMRGKLFTAIKISLLSGTGGVLVFLTNFFHILDWVWGMGILAIAIILIFIILFPHEKKEKEL